MVYSFIIFMLGCGYYTLTYGLSLWKDDHNRLGAVAVIAAAAAGTVLPAVMLIYRA